MAIQNAGQNGGPAYNGGRPTVRTPENAERICELIRDGMPTRWAAIHAGVSESVFFAWQASDTDFREKIKAARAAKIKKFVKYVADAAPANWAAAMTLLERTEHEDFGRQNRVRVQQEGSVQIDVRHMMATPAQIALAASMEAEYAEDNLAEPKELPAHTDSEDSTT